MCGIMIMCSAAALYHDRMQWHCLWSPKEASAGRVRAVPGEEGLARVWRGVRDELLMGVRSTAKLPLIPRKLR